MDVSRRMLKNTLAQIKNDLEFCLKHQIVPDTRIKINWLYQTVEYLNYAIIELDKITSEYKALYKNKNSVNDEFYLVKKREDIIFYARSFFEGVFVYYTGLINKNGLDIFTRKVFFIKFKEIGYVCKIRNFFIVHPSEFLMSFYFGIKTTPTENILFPSFSGSYKKTEDDTMTWYREVFDKSLSYKDLVIKNDAILLNNKQKIMKVFKAIEFSVLSEKDLKYIRLKGIPDFDQNQFSKDLINLHKEVFKKLDL